MNSRAVASLALSLTMAAFLAAPAPAQTRAQAVREAQVRKAADSAQKLQAGGKSSQALELLGRERRTCAPGAEGRACRQILDYSLGYVLQQSSAGSKDPGATLRRALPRARHGG